MNGRTRSTKAGSGTGIASSPADSITTAASAPPEPLPPNEALRQRKYRKLVRKHLDKLLDRLFAELTGLHFHVAWAPSPPYTWAAQTLPTGCSGCCRLSGSPLRPGCRICGPRQLSRALSADGDGHRFTCRLGVRNFWFPLRIRGEILGVAYLQALHHSTRKLRARKRFARADAIVLNGAAFDRAARFLQLIVQHAQTASLSDLRKADLTSAGHALVALEKEQARLHEMLKRHLPPAPQAPRRTGPQSHPEQLVHRLLGCIEQNYGQTITLRRCAGKLGMNAAYASALFSRAVGVPFKAHLTELRMAKAKELLGDPTKTASGVACAVGYASENRFRIAFKKATGLSPKLWRETMQTTPPPPSKPRT